MKKIIPTTNRPRPADFDIVEKIGRNCYFQDGVFIHSDSEGDSYLSCELPLCQNGDRIEVGNLYKVTYDFGYVTVVQMKLEPGIRHYWMITGLDTEGQSIESGYCDNFLSIFW